MKTFVKNYIGKGKQIGDMSIVRISCKMEDLKNLTHEYNGEEYITFEVAKLKSPDQFGNQFTAYVSTLEEAPEVKTPSGKSTFASKAPKSRKQKGNASYEPEGNLPF